MESLNIIKPSVIEGGEYDEIRVFADATFNGPIKAQTLDVYEKATFHGSVKAKHIKINGHAIFKGGMIAQKIVINGRADYHHEDVKTNDLELNGEAECHSKCETYHTRINGKGTFSELDSFHLIVKGTIDCTELLRANNVEFLENSSGNLNVVMGANVALEPVMKQIKINDLTAYHVILKNCHVKVLKTKTLEVDKQSIVEKQITI